MPSMELKPSKVAPADMKTSSFPGERSFHQKVRHHVAKKGKVYAEMDLHGMADFVEAETVCLKIFWGLIVCTAIAVAIYMCILIVQSAIKSPSVTKIDYISTHDIDYPQITVCPEAAYFLNKSKLDADGILESTIEQIFLTGPIMELPNPSPTDAYLTGEETASQIRKLQERFGHTAQQLITGFFHHYSLDCNSLFRSCRDANWRNLDCCQVFKPIFHMRHGLCYGSDPKLMPTIKAPFLFSNLFIKFNRPADLYVAKSSESEASNKADLTLQVIIDSGLDQGVWRADIVLVEYGWWHTIKVSNQHISTESTKRNPCVEEAELHYFKDYTFSNCMWERRLLLHPNFTTPNNCSLPIADLTKMGFAALGGKGKKNESKEGEGHQQSGGSEGEHEGHKMEKRVACTKAEIESYIFRSFTASDGTRLATADLLTGLKYWMAKLQMSSVNPCAEPCDHWQFSYTEDRVMEFPQKDFAGFTITVIDSQYPHIREVPIYEWQDYMALFGGIWGLWVGASVVTCVQLLVYTFKFFGGDKLLGIREETAD